MIDKHQLKPVNRAVPSAVVRHYCQRCRWFWRQSEQKQRGLVREIFAFVADQRAKLLEYYRKAVRFRQDFSLIYLIFLIPIIIQTLSFRPENISRAIRQFMEMIEEVR
jgi:hypothetical protein